MHHWPNLSILALRAHSRAWRVAACALVFALGMVSTLHAPRASAQAPTATPALSEGQVKAALVFNFARYIEWPPTSFAAPADPFTICNLGRDTLGGALQAFEGPQLNNRSVKVRNTLTPDDTRGCQVVFIAESEERRLLPILKSLQDKPILPVSDIAGFAEAGGAIAIVQGETRLQFDVNRRAIENAKLKASSNLLKLARTLIDRPDSAGK
jgi:hypothetical protein